MTKEMMLIQNAAECRKCGDYIFSKHRHNFVTCKCGAISVDGGMDYIRWVGDFSEFIDKSHFMPKDAVEACKNAVQWGLDNRRNNLGIALAVIRALREHDLIKEIENEV